MAYGQDGHIGISFQDSLGTSNVDSMDFFPFVSETLTEAIEDLISESLESRYEEPDAYEGMHSIAGEIVMDVHPALVGKLLVGFSGQESVTYTVSCYNHLCLPRTDDWDAEKSSLQPMTIEVYRDTGSAYLYYDMLLNTLAFSITQGSILRTTAGFIGAQATWSAKQTASYEGGSYFLWDTVSVELGGAANDESSNLELTFNNNLAGKAYLDGNKYFGRVLRDGYRTCEIAGTMLLVGDTEARNFKNRTTQRLRITATDPATVMLHHHQIIIDIPQMRYTEFPGNIGGPGLVEVGFSAKSTHDATSDYSFQFTIINTKDAYV